ncbi:MAG: sigma-70 family RNA polymerase sigma factor [Planctomycetes bacterium]|nr:sigma-70 family RNA polymerase sigma factor [Planctomycetota bacterium]
MTDEELVDEHRAGRADAFDRLVERYRAPAYRFCYRMLGNHHEAEDASQEAFVRTFTGLARFRREAPFRSWLFHILANVCLTWRRSMRDKPGAFATDPPAERQPAPIELDEFQKQLQAAIQRLPDKQRLTLILRVDENCGFEEIARILDITPLAARVNLSLARRNLRETMPPHLLEPCR